MIAAVTKHAIQELQLYHYRHFALIFGLYEYFQRAAKAERT